MRAREFIKKKPYQEAEMPWKDAVDAGAMTTQQGAKIAASDISQAINDLSTKQAAIGQEIQTQRAAAASVPSNVQVTNIKPDGSWTGREIPKTTKMGPISITRGAGNPAAGGAVKKVAPSAALPMEEELDENGLTWREYPCTQDCSGHQAGDKWAQARGIKDPNLCPPGNSNSWHEGCRSEAEGRPY